jgi:Protein of unknown function (DUF2393)
MASGDQQTGFLSPTNQTAKEPRSLTPWIVAGGVVLLVIVGLVLVSHHARPANPGGAVLAPADPYAANLPLTNIQMSESSTMGGSKLTYLDGTIANHGAKTVTGVTVQVAFHDYTHQIAQKETMRLNLIRMRDPYVDTQAVSAAPIKPGDSREFRLIFDHVAEKWNQEYPEVRVIEVEAK